MQWVEHQVLHDTSRFSRSDESIQQHVEGLFSAGAQVLDCRVEFFLSLYVAIIFILERERNRINCIFGSIGLGKKWCGGVNLQEEFAGENIKKKGGVFFTKKKYEDFHGPEPRVEK